MTAILALSAVLMAQAGPASLGDDTTVNQDVAYEELVSGEAQLAIQRLEAALETNPGDPALLINLGSAYARTGDREKAAELYRAAIDSDVRYRLELADGDWMDSRHAARMALRALESSELAMN